MKYVYCRSVVVFRVIALGLLAFGAAAIRAQSSTFTDANWVSIGGLAYTFSPGNGSCVTFDRAGNLYLGGYFTTVGGTGANCIARWDGTNWFPVGGGMSSAVASIAFDPVGNIYAAGNFFTAGGQPITNLAKWDGTNWSAVGGGTDMFGAIAAVACDKSGNLYIGGYFATVGGIGIPYIARWDGTNWHSLGSGIDPGFYGSSGSVQSMAFDRNGNLYVGGIFQRAGGITCNSIAKWDGTNWSALGGGLNNSANAMTFDSAGNLYVGGGFSTPANHVARWDGTNWFALGSGVGAGVDALACDTFGNLYAGGFFTTTGDGTNANYVAKWNGTNWSPLGSGFDDNVHGLGTDKAGNLYVAGQFNTAGGISSRGFAKALLSRSSSIVSLTRPVPTTNVITALGTPNFSYALELATNLNPPIAWKSLGTNTDPSGTLLYTNVNGTAQGFYRMRFVP